jgi:predicted permease
MKEVRAWLFRIAGVFNRRQRELELAEEIECHLRMHIDDSLRSGMTAEEARRLALIKLGGIAPTQETYRDRVGIPFLETLAEDIRYSFRMLRKTPLFTTVALLTLTLGIGANTAIFTLTNALFLRSLPVPEAKRLALITYEHADSKRPLTLKMFNDIKQSEQVFTGMLAWADYTFQWSEDGEIKLLPGALASGDSFSTLELKPTLGRLLTAADDHLASGVGGWAAVISYDFWQKHFNFDPNVIGRAINLNSVPVKVVGVMPAGFEGVNIGSRPSIVLPPQFAAFSAPKQPSSPLKGNPIFTVIGRMKPGITLAQAHSELDRIAIAVIENSDISPTEREIFFPGARIALHPGAAGYSGARNLYRRSLVVLEILVTIILLLCCTNLAGLFSARVAARQRDLAVRSALGADRFRLARELFIEIALLIPVAATLALLLAHSIAAALISALSLRQWSRISLDTSPDRNVLLLTVACSFGAALLAGVIPAFRTARSHFNPNVPESTAWHSRVRSLTRFGKSLVSIQVAVSFTLLVAAGLFTATLHRLLTVHLGFNPENVLVVPTALKDLPETGARRVALYERILQRLNTMPGIQIASGAALPLLQGIQSNIRFVSIGSHGETPRNINLSCNRIGRRYFELMGTRILAGRNFTLNDEHSHHHVCILSSSAAKHLFPQGNAIGSYLNEPEEEANLLPYEIVGIAENTMFSDLREQPADAVYLSFQPGDVEPEFNLIIKTNDVAAAIASSRKVLHELVPNLPFYEPITEHQQLNASVARERVVATLANSFAALALLLTAIGVYGMLAFQVRQRTTEIGVRIALGAQRRGVLQMVLGQALLPTSVGALVGTAAALASSPLFAALLYGIRASDPRIYVGTMGVLTLVAILAAWVPARRAASIDPMAALRCE